jgi:hypothetical protein
MTEKKIILQGLNTFQTCYQLNNLRFIMTEKKIYLTAEKWWEERKKVLNEDLTNAKNFTADQELIKLMQELLKKAKINTMEGG